LGSYVESVRQAWIASCSAVLYGVPVRPRIRRGSIPGDIYLRIKCALSSHSGCSLIIACKLSRRRSNLVPIDLERGDQAWAQARGELAQLRSCRLASQSNGSTLFSVRLDLQVEPVILAASSGTTSTSQAHTTSGTASQDSKADTVVKREKVGRPSRESSNSDLGSPLIEMISDSQESEEDEDVEEEEEEDVVTSDELESTDDEVRDDERLSPWGRRASEYANGKLASWNGKGEPWLVAEEEDMANFLASGPTDRSGASIWKQYVEMVSPVCLSRFRWHLQF
jgi:hypothetical protein